MFYRRLLDLCSMRDVKITNLVPVWGISSGNLSKWKSGGVPRGDTLCKIADYFNVTVDYLLGRTDDPRPAGQGSGTALTGAQQQLLECYTRASPDDKEAVDAVLRKYRSKQAPIALVAARGGGVMEIPAKIADAITVEMVPSDDGSL